MLRRSRRTAGRSSSLVAFLGGERPFLEDLPRQGNRLFALALHRGHDEIFERRSLLDVDLKDFLGCAAAIPASADPLLRFSA